MKDKELRDMMAERQVFIDKREAYYDKFTDEELGSDDFEDLPEDPRCEELRIAIHDFIEKNHTELTVESVLEGMTSIGSAPSLLYDDNGNFAMGEDGMQNVTALEVKEKGDRDSLDFQGVWFLKKRDWKPTIREAIERYFEKMKEL